MALTTYSEFEENFLVRNGMPSNDINLNKAPKQLKNEIEELNISKQNELISEINKQQDIFYTSSRGVNETNIVTSTSVEPMVEAIFKNEKLTHKIENLSSKSNKIITMLF